MRASALPGMLADHVVEVGVGEADAGGQLLGPGRVVVEELLGEPDAADVDRHDALDVVGADDELGGPAADVDDEERAEGGVEVAGGPDERQAPLLVAADSSSGRAPTTSLDRVEELVAVGRVAGGGGGRDPHPVDAVLVEDRRGSRAGTASVRSTASSARRPVAPTPWPSRVIVLRRSRMSSLPSTGRATRRRVELVPMSMEATTVIRTNLPGRTAGRSDRRPSARPGRRPRPGTRRSGRAGTSRPCGCRPTPPEGRGPAWPGGSAASRSAA